MDLKAWKVLDDSIYKRILKITSENENFLYTIDKNEISFLLGVIDDLTNKLLEAQGEELTDTEWLEELTREAEEMGMYK